MKADDANDTERDEKAGGREEYAGWDPYIIDLCRRIDIPEPDTGNYGDNLLDSQSGKPAS